jgi:hypothetical protein
LQNVLSVFRQFREPQQARSVNLFCTAAGVYMLIQVEVASFAVDPGRNTPVIILKEVSGERTLPVPIGPLEASAIAIESLKV